MDSYSSQEAGFPEVLLGFLLSLKAVAEMVPEDCPLTFFHHSFQFVIHGHFTIQSCAV